MNIESLRDYCIAKAWTIEELPFDEDVLVFKVGGKMYALCSLSNFGRGVALKCDPERAVELRELYPQVKPAYHMCKAHWNDVQPEEGLPDQLLRHWIDVSYSLVVAKLSKAKQKELYHL